MCCVYSPRQAGVHSSGEENDDAMAGKGNDVEPCVAGDGVHIIFIEIVILLINHQP